MKHDWAKAKDVGFQELSGYLICKKCAKVQTHLNKNAKCKGKG